MIANILNDCNQPGAGDACAFMFIYFVAPGLIVLAGLVILGILIAAICWSWPHLMHFLGPDNKGGNSDE